MHTRFHIFARIAGTSLNQIGAARNSVGLFRRELPDSHLVDEAQRSLFLDLPRMKRDLGNVEARVPRDIYRAQLSGIEPDSYFTQSKSYRIVDGCSCGPAKTATRIATSQPDEVPPGLPNPQIQCGGNSISGRRPRLVKRLLYKIEVRGQQAASTQKY